MSLPSGYKLLEYIQSSGTQYIDTGFKPNQDTSVFATAKITDVSSYPSIFGARNKNTQMYWMYNNGNGAISTSFVVKINSTEYSLSSAFGEKQTYSIDSGIAKVGESNVNVSMGTFQSSYNLYLFGTDNVGSLQYPAKMKLYSCQIYDNGTLVRDFVPCQKPDGTIGLWDDVNSLFYGNAGTGTFTAGPVLAIVANASEITKLEYIESSGTQYINTGFKPNNNTRVVMDLLYTGSESISNEFGAWNSSNNASFICLTTGKNNLYPFYGNTSKQVSANRTARHTVDMDKNVVKMNGTTMITFNQMSFHCTYPMFLCCFNNAGATENMTSMRIYSCQIYDNGTLIRDYIAAKLSDGTIGLYDKLHGLLYTNVGTGTFIAGPVVTSPSIFVNIDGIWKPINHIYVNINNIWQKST